MFPCSQEEGHSCSIVCAHGYVINGSSKQTCVFAGTLDWTVAPMCEGSMICMNGLYISIIDSPCIYRWLFARTFYMCVCMSVCVQCVR